MSRGRSIYRFPTGNISTFDRTTVLPTTGPQNYTENLNDSLVFTESNNTVAARFESQADSLILTDASSTVLGNKETVSDSLVFTDAATFVYTPREALSENLVFTDAQNSVAAFKDTISDALVLTDASTTVQAASESRQDALVLSDASATNLGAVEARSDALSLSESQSTVQAMGNTAADAVVFSDSQNTIGTFGESRADSLTFNDAVSTVAHRFEVTTETVLFTDATSHVAHFIQPSLLDTVIFSDSESDSLGGSHSYSETLVDSVVFTTLSNQVQNTHEVVNDVLGWVDNSSNRLAAYSLLLGDTLSLSDVATVLLTLHENRQDTLTLVDSYRDLTIQIVVRWVTSSLIKQTGEGALIVSNSSDEIKRGLSSKGLIATGD